MSALYSSLELEDISRNPFETDSEIVKGPFNGSAQFEGEDSSPKSDTNSTYRPVEPNVDRPLRPSLRPRRRRGKWRSITIHCSACCIVSGAIVTLIVLPLSNLGANSQYISPEFPSFGVCEPDGSFNTGLDPVSVWSPSKAFQITLGFGSFRFSKAKFVDIVWDIAIGRGLQAILGFIMYRTFTKSLARHMERSPVSFGTFESVSLQGASVKALVTLFRDYLTNSGVRAKLTVTWMILALSYVLIFPTLMSAMTGYSAATQPYILIPDGSEIEWSSFRLINYIIYDGWRIGLTGGYFVNAVSRYATSDPSDYFDADVCSYYLTSKTGVVEILNDPGKLEDCLLTIAISQYVRAYGFHGKNHTSSTFSPDNSTFYNLTSSTLNVSAFYLYPDNDLSGSESIYDGGFTSPEYFNNASLARFARIDQPDNRTYDVPFIRDNGRCQQQNTYQWGYSFLLLFIALLLSALWALGMWAMWLDAYYNSKIDANGGRDMGSWRAMMDLAEGITESLNSDLGHGQDPVALVGDGTRDLGDAEIRRRVRLESGRGRIGYVDMFGPDKAILTRAGRLRRWLERRKWGRWLLKRRRWVIAGTVLVLPGIAVLLLLIPPSRDY